MYHWRYFNEQVEAPIYYIQNFFDTNKASHFLDHFDNAKLDEAMISTEDNGMYVINKEKRKTDVKFFINQHLTELCHSAVHIANDICGWNFDLGTMEAFQFGKYKIGDKFDWHIDGEMCHHSVRKWNHPEGKYDISKSGNAYLLNTVRKISGIILLNDDFKGGDFEVKWFDPHKVYTKKIEWKAGDCILFPSNVIHRVNPITEGTRYSITFWVTGKPLV